MGDTHDALAAYAARRARTRMPDVALEDVVDRLDHAREAAPDPPTYRRAALEIIRVFVFGDLEDPADDPELGVHS